jgi:hypothetical protein
LDSYDEITWSYKVNGTVTFQIIGKSAVSDSIIWNMQQTNNLVRNRNGSCTVDTSKRNFNLVEINNGNHRLHSSGFPFYSVPFDSMVMNRYTYIDTSRQWSFETENGRSSYTYTFKRDVGALSYSALDMCACLDYWDEIYSLMNNHSTGVESHGEMNHIKEFVLGQNYPNPFNPMTTISFYLPSRSFVSLKVFDMLGREVATIVSEEMQAGNYSQQWNAVNISSGVYFYRLQAGSFTETKKLIVLK